MIYLKIIIFTMLVLSIKLFIGCQKNYSKKYPQKVLDASIEFKKSWEYRHKHSSYLLSHIDKGASKKEILFLLGKPDRITKENKNEIWSYTTFYSMYFNLTFKSNKLIEIVTPYDNE